jgi:hypothetical protein
MAQKSLQPFLPLPLAAGMFSQNGQHGAYGPYDLSNQAAVDRLRLRCCLSFCLRV